MNHTILIGLGVLIAILTVVAAFGWLPSLRIVPDNTHFDFTRFRRISFPISAALSIVAITLFFTHGLNFGIDFRGGTLLEVQAKSGTADIAALCVQRWMVCASAKSSCSSSAVRPTS
ncbi:preprotein translocase subunit SecF [Bradyrhizobium sp. LM4.3]